MKKLYGLLACLAVIFGAFLVTAPAASAATGIISNGIAWTSDPAAVPPGPLDPSPYCTLGVVGTDNLGNKIAISARHCVEAVHSINDGDPVYRYTPTGAGSQIGTVAYRSANSPVSPHGTDWVVIKLNTDADLRSQGPGARIDGIGTPFMWNNLCKDGVTTGITCGAIYGLTPERINSFAAALGGDSGGPAFIGGTTKIVGMTRGAAEFINFGAVLAEINGQSNPVGKGFVVTNN